MRITRNKEPRLDPVRWPRWPGRAIRLRALVVAILLVTAAGVVYASSGTRDPSGCAAVPAVGRIG